MVQKTRGNALPKRHQEANVELGSPNKESMTKDEVFFDRITPIDS